MLGTNETGRLVAKVLSLMGGEPKAFINDYEGIGEFCGRPIISTAEIPREALVVSCSTGVNPATALHRLKAAGIERVLDYFTVYISGNGVFPPPKFCAENIADVETNWPKYEWVQSMLADEVSKHTFQKLVEFRYNFDLSAMAGFQTQLEAQYFEPFVPLDGREVFVDGGGFDGTTTETFIQRCPKYRRVHYFEPDPLLMSSSKKRLGSFEHVHYYEAALSDHEGQVAFNQTGTGSGAVSEEGELHVRTCRLDGLLPEPPTFVKLDVEGAELSALRGAESIVRVNHPGWQCVFIIANRISGGCLKKYCRFIPDTPFSYATIRRESRKR